MRGRFFAALAGSLAPLLAGGAAVAKTGGMPQLHFPDYTPQVVWLVITFVALYLIMSRLAMPAIAGTLEKRQAKIQGDLDAAERANEETRQLLAAYEKRLSDAREDARRLQRERADADNAELANRLSALGERLGAEVGEAERRIAEQRTAVLAGLEQMARDVAASVYAKLTGQPADPGALDAKVATAAKASSR